MSVHPRSPTIVVGHIYKCPVKPLSTWPLLPYYLTYCVNATRLFFTTLLDQLSTATRFFCADNTSGGITPKLNGVDLALLIALHDATSRARTRHARHALRHRVLAYITTGDPPRRNRPSPPASPLSWLALFTATRRRACTKFESAQITTEAANGYEVITQCGVRTDWRNNTGRNSGPVNLSVDNMWSANSSENYGSTL